MPYRRLPNTDQARVRALQTIVEVGESASDILALPYTLHMLTKAGNFLRIFKQKHNYYKLCYQKQSKASKRHQVVTKQARLYISHFVQVLNLAIQREEIPVSDKSYYDLEADNLNIPDISSDASLYAWGPKIIDGEHKRTSYGGAPIYSPTIAKVKVFFDLFKEGYENQKNLQRLTATSLEEVAVMRGEADELLLEIWNSIEDHHKDIESIEQRCAACRKYGVVYYYRSSEKRKHTLSATLEL